MSVEIFTTIHTYWSIFHLKSLSVSESNFNMYLIVHLCWWKSLFTVNLGRPKCGERKQNSVWKQGIMLQISLLLWRSYFCRTIDHVPLRAEVGLVWRSWTWILYCKITEWLRLEKTSGGHLAQPSFSCWMIQGHCLQLCLAGFWIYPGMETLENLWARDNVLVLGHP